MPPDIEENRRALCHAIQIMPEKDQARFQAVVAEVSELVLASVSTPATLLDLREKYRTALHEITPPMRPSTIRNRVYRLNLLMEQATKEGLLAAFAFDPAFPPLERGSSAPERRRYEAYRMFEQYCAMQRIALGQVCSTHFIEYRHALLARLSRSVAETRYDDLRRFWNERTDEGRLPPLQIPRWNESRNQNYGLPADKWPQPWQDLWHRFVCSAQGRPLGDDPAWKTHLSKEGINIYRRNFSELLGCMVIHGRNPQVWPPEVVFADIATVKEFISWHIAERCKGKARDYHAQILKRLARIADRLLLKPDSAKQFVRLADSIESDTVRERIAFEDLCYRTLETRAYAAMEEAHREWQALHRSASVSAKRTAAIRYRSTLLILWLLRRPLRASNIAALRSGRHIRIFDDQRVTIEIPAHETKGKHDWKAFCPTRMASFLRFYCQSILPVLDDSVCPLLFPSKSGKRLSRSSLWRIVRSAAPRVLGISCSTHDFRGLVITLYLLAFPDRLQEARDVLGHRNVETTLRHYIHLTTILASRRVPAFLTETCSAAASVADWRPGKALDFLSSQPASL